MTRLFPFIGILLSTTLKGQVSKVSLQASGLTCSMCSNSIYKSLKTVPFVDKVEPNIRTSTFEITFKNNSAVDFNKLRDKVEDAGYAVARFIATINFKNSPVKQDEATTIGNLKLRFVNVKEQSLDGERNVRILNKGFVPVREFKKNAPSTEIAPNVYLVSI